MLLTLINLLQTQKISWLVWAGAGLVLVTGISLVVYLLIRLKKSDKEQEEDWSVSRSLFVDTASPAPKEEAKEPIEQGAPEIQKEVFFPQSVEAIEMPESEETEAPVVEEAETPHAGQTLSFASETAEVRPSTIEQPEAVSPSAYEQQEPFVPASEPLVEEAPKQPAQPESATELLTSPPSREAGAIEEDEDSPFDEIWAELVEQTPAQAPSGEVERSSPARPALEQPAAEPVEPPLSARVEQSPPRETFEPPRIRPLNQRETFEPPRIEPISPREPTVRTTEPSRPAGSRAPEEFSEAKAYDEFEPSATHKQGEADRRYIAEPAPAAPVASSGMERGRKRKAAGTVLGLPTESSGGPLVFGERPPGEDEGGVGSLARYGKDPDKGGGHGGTITLAVLILLIGGGALAYFYVPAVNSRVNAFVARVRGENTQAAQPVRAQIFPDYRPQVDKGNVKARGNIYNIGDEPLEGLSIEVAIEINGTGEIENRTISIIPDRLEKEQHGTYEFDYDGKRYKGYRITKLNGKTGEVRFTTPQQNR
ncbi:MAG: hypothetical protein L0229_03050 [Blastocatellia bacterium]|nr:hypothetical protein [Blastocatellia bacterium]